MKCPGVSSSTSEGSDENWEMNLEFRMASIFVVSLVISSSVSVWLPVQLCKWCLTLYDLFFPGDLIDVARLGAGSYMYLVFHYSICPLLCKFLFHLENI